MGKCLSRDHGRNVARYGANVRPFYDLTRPEIDAVRGWNGNSAAKVVHFGNHPECPGGDGKDRPRKAPA